MPLAGAFGVGALASASAQAYPTRPIKMIVPYLPAGPIDTMARLLGRQLSERFGQQVVIDNRLGAGLLLGGKAAAGAEPDGYTLLFGSSGSLAVAPALYSNFDLDIRKASCRSARSRCCLTFWWSTHRSRPRRSASSSPMPSPGKLNYGAPDRHAPAPALDLVQALRLGSMWSMCPTRVPAWPR